MKVSKGRWRRVRRGVLLASGLSLACFAFLVVDAWVPSGRPPSGARLERLRSSPQYRSDRFVDFLPRREPELWPTLSRWMAGAPNTTPLEPVPISSRVKSEYETPPQGGLRLTWLGHSTTLVELEGQTFLLDPVFSERCSPSSFFGPARFHPPPLPTTELPAISAVVISHDHYDHLDHRSVQALNGTGTRFIVPLGVGSHLEYWEVDAARITELDWWQSTRVGPVEVTATPARHFSGRSLVMADRDATLWAGWALTGPRQRVYYSGDTAMFPELRQIGERLGPFDVTLIEVGAYNQLWADVHLGPEQALDAHRLVRGELLIPVHWGTFDLALHAWTEPMERVLVGAAERGIRVVTPRPGDRVEPANPPAPRRWWPELPWETSRQSPVISSGLSQASDP